MNFTRIILAIFLCVILAVSVDAAVPSHEREALVALYNSTDGANWENNTNWLEGDPCSNLWFGVTCDDSGTTVMDISLEVNQLSGPIPPELGELTNL